MSTSVVLRSGGVSFKEVEGGVIEEGIGRGRLPTDDEEPLAEVKFLTGKREGKGPRLGLMLIGKVQRSSRCGAGFGRRDVNDEGLGAKKRQKLPGN